MTKKILLSILVPLLISCGKDADFTLTGKINGLKKGTLYLQKVEDTTLVNLDSIVITSDPEFELRANIKEPQILYLTLDKVDRTDYDDRILFFAEPGVMTLTTSLKNFEGQAAITGSENQLKLQEYKEIANKFNGQNLDLIKKTFDAQKANNEDSLVLYDKQIQNLIRRKYLYTVNFALNNKNLEVAPFLAVSEIFDANVKYLDTIYKSLEPKVRKSMYGKTLKEFIKERKGTDKDMDTIQVIKTEEVE